MVQATLKKKKKKKKKNEWNNEQNKHSMLFQNALSNSLSWGIKYQSKPNICE